MLSANEEYAWSILYENENGEIHAEPLKAELNREVGKRISSILKKEVNFHKPDVVVHIDLKKDEVRIHPRSVFIKGRYRKLVRGFPQTRWPHRVCRGRGCEECGFTGKQYPESVDELVSKRVIEEFKAEDTVFHGAGREDIDARMLGRGRPFVLEVIKPRKRKIDLKWLEKEINEYCTGKVEVIGLEYAEREDVLHVKSIKPPKIYRVRVEFEKEVERREVEEALQKLKDTVIFQRTPKRVLHRRADLIRERRIMNTKLVSHQGREAVIEIEAESGTYIKELVSGDEGRTSPSLSELLGLEARVIELDVLEVLV